MFGGVRTIGKLYDADTFDFRFNLSVYLLHSTSNV